MLLFIRLLMCLPSAQALSLQPQPARYRGVAARTRRERDVRERRIVTDQLRSYPAAKADIAELAGVKQVFVKVAARVNNRAENSHQATRQRERVMSGFRDSKRTQAFLSSFGPIRQHFALPRHRMTAACHRAILKERLAT